MVVNSLFANKVPSRVNHVQLHLLAQQHPQFLRKIDDLAHYRLDQKKGGNWKKIFAQKKFKQQNIRFFWVGRKKTGDNTGEYFLENGIVLLRLFWFSSANDVIVIAVFPGLHCLIRAKINVSVQEGESMRSPVCNACKEFCARKALQRHNASTYTVFHLCFARVISGFFCSKNKKRNF